MRAFLPLSLALIFCSALTAASARTTDPFLVDEKNWAPDFSLYNDDINPTEAERFVAFSRLDEAFASCGKGAPSRARTRVAPSDGFCVFVERQDYASLTVGASCVGERFNVGGKSFERGLGTHANSVLRCVAPEPIVAFRAFVGLNGGLGGGSVAFSVVDDSTDAEPVWRSETLKTGDAAVAVDARFKRPTRSFSLLASTTEDGPEFDQANWLNPIAVGESGREYALDEAAISRMTLDLPFSFTLGGRSSRELLPTWEFSHTTTQDSRGRSVDVYQWSDPDTGLVLTAEARLSELFAAADWTLTIENKGKLVSPLLENVKPLDATFDFGVDFAPWIVGTLAGDTYDAGAWAPKDLALDVDGALEFAPHGGRSSNGAFPFWTITPRQTTKNERTDGFCFALGWSGQWKASFSRPKGKKSVLRVEAGMENFSSVVYPGDKFRMPRALVMPWNGTRAKAQVLFRRMLMNDYAPRIEDKPIRLDVVAQCFDRYYRKRAGWEKIDAQLESARALKEIGGTAYWFDAAWFPVGFPNGVGNWFSDPDNFPNGVEELGNALKELDLNFVLWFEPERVAPNTEFATKYPQFVFGGDKGGLFKLNERQARKFLADLLIKRIRDFNVDVFRIDFNMDPLWVWRQADAPNRQGVTEARYVEGLYELWDTILASKPGLWIDNCASGGRRIDLETISRAVPLWRSDTCCTPGHPEWEQAHTMGIAQFLPLFSCCAWSSDPYTFRSASNPGAILQYDFLDPTYDRARASASVAEAKRYQKFWYGDFYPLTSSPVGKESTVAWQLHRPDLNAGLIYVFRQTESRYPVVEIEPRAIDPDAEYWTRVKYGYEDVEKTLMTGKELIEYNAVLKEKGSAVVVEYWLKQEK